MTHVKALKESIDISVIDFKTNPFSLGNVFTIKNGNSKGDKFGILFNGKSTRGITFVARDVSVKIKAKFSSQFKSWQYQIFFSEDSTGTAGKIFELMNALDQVLTDNEQTIREKYGFTTEAAYENFGRPVFEIIETSKPKKKAPQTEKVVRMCSLPLTEARKDVGTLLMAQTKDVSDLLGFTWTNVKGKCYGSGNVSNFQNYASDDTVKQNPTLKATLRFVIDHYGTGTKNSNFRIYTNSVMITGIVSKSESIQQLMEEEGWFDDETSSTYDSNQDPPLSTDTQPENEKLNTNVHSEPEVKPEIQEPEDVRRERLTRLPEAKPEFKPLKSEMLQPIKLQTSSFSGKIPYEI